LDLRIRLSTREEGKDVAVFPSVYLDLLGSLL